MKFAAKPLAAVATLTFAASALAAGGASVLPLETSWSELVKVAAPTFSNQFWFTAPQGAVSVSGSVVSIDFDIAGKPFWNIDNIQISLFEEGKVAALDLGTAGEGSALQNVHVTPGAAYYFKVTGEVPSPASSGLYSFLAVAAIPEPETFALMLGGLGLVGFVASRRRRLG